MIARPIAAIGKDEDGFDVDIVKVPDARIVPFFVGQLAEWSGLGIGLDYVPRCDYVFESVPLGDFTAFLAYAAYHQHGVVFGGHLAHGCVTADKLAGGHF